MSEANSTESTPRREPRDPSISSLFIRDVALLLGLFTFWGAGDTWALSSDLAIANLVATLGAALTGLVLGALWHEWGHFSGAIASRAKSRTVQPKGFSLVRFRFDFDANDTRQFHWMTLGGQIAHWLLVLLVLVAIPMDTANRVALLAGAVAFAVFASTIEAPVLKDSTLGVAPLQALRNNIDKAAFTRCRYIGGGAGILLFALLT